MKGIFIFSILTIHYFGFSSGIGFLGLSSVFSGWKFCWINNCCTEQWDEAIFKGIREDLESKVYGQQIAVNVLVNHLKVHLTNEKPKKALALSLHGTTGSGKNYMTAIAVGRLAKEGMKDRSVKIWSAKHHFYDKDRIPEYEKELRDVIKQMTSSCARSIFIFDEANELPSGLLDVLKPLMDEYDQLDGVDYRKTTFFFLSNTGATKINEKLLQLKKQNKDRFTLKIGDFQDLIQGGSFNEKGGFLKCKLIEKNLIDSYIPFLPLEKKHVKLCIRYYLQDHRCPQDQDFIEKVADLVNYEPSGYNYFSSYGCRGIENLVMQEIDHSCIYNRPKSEL